MTNIEKTLKEFDEKFTYKNNDGKTIVRYALCQNPETLSEELKAFITQALQNKEKEIVLRIRKAILELRETGDSAKRNWLSIEDVLKILKTK